MRLVLILFFLTIVTPAYACGVSSDCKLGGRSYRIYMPAHGTDKPIGAVIFAHGWRGTAAGIMQNKSLLALADELGAALVAPQSVGTDWRLPGRPRQKNNTGKEEFDYFRRLVDTLETRHGIDRKRLLMSGFSAGGMLTWNLACHTGKLFAGFAPIAGTFWQPVPKTCPSAPVDLIHFHGTSDTMVPLTGRAIADSAQGEVPKALALFASEGEFGAGKPVSARALECTRRKNSEGRILEFCIHPGGHIYKADYVRRAWKAFGLDEQ